MALSKYVSTSQSEWSMRNAALNNSIGKNTNLREANAHLNSTFGSLLKTPVVIPNEAVQAAFADDPTLESSLVTILANFELMAVAIHMKVADDAVAFEMHVDPVLHVVTKFREYIDHRRATDNPRAFEHLTRLAQEWSTRLERLPT